jgi:SNF2 family DNA or RNA helicase
MIPECFPYQAKAIRFSCSVRNSYQALDMGLGKTRIALEWAMADDSGVLVVAPKRAIFLTWPDEIEKWIPGTSYRVIHGPDKSLRPSAKFLITNYETLKWLYEELFKLYKAKKKMPFKKLIIDEGSMVKSHRTKRFKLLQDMRHLFTGGIIILSGTPATKGLPYLWSQYFILDGGKRLGGSYNKFIQSYFDYVDRSGQVMTPRNEQERHRAKLAIKSPEHEARIHKLISDITYRIDGSEHLDLPDLVYNTIDVELPSHVKKMINDFKKHKVQQFGENKASASFAAAVTGKIRQMTQGCIYTDYEEGMPKPKGPRKYERLHSVKLDALKSIVEEASGQGILCAIQYRFELDIILEAFPGTPAIVGGKKEEESMDAIRAWNKGELPLMLCHPQSLSHSVNLQTGSHILVYYGIPWSLEQYLQLNKRLHRTGQRNTVIIHHILAKNSVDTFVMQALKENKSIEDALLEFLLKTTEARDLSYEE